MRGHNQIILNNDSFSKYIITDDLHMYLEKKDLKNKHRIKRLNFALQTCCIEWNYLSVLRNKNSSDEVSNAKSKLRIYLHSRASKNTCDLGLEDTLFAPFEFIWFNWYLKGGGVTSVWKKNAEKKEMNKNHAVDFMSAICAIETGVTPLFQSNLSRHQWWCPPGVFTILGRDFAGSPSC